MLIAANWKAYVGDLGKARTLVRIAKRLSRKTKNDIVLIPPAPLLGMFAGKNKSAVSFGAQDISSLTGGAETGEVTAAAIKASGATYVIVGHSERRRAGDTPTVVAEKLTRALANGLIPVLCVGESERDGEGRYLSFVREQLTSALRPQDAKERKKVIVAYEPIWAIGKTATDAILVNDLAEMVLYIRKVLAELLPGKTSARTFVLYGGSVEPGNIRDLAATSDVDGFLIGHASVDPRMFAALVTELS